jgi:uncharacterized membrane protein YjgN (DUF898 family)
MQQFILLYFRYFLGVKVVSPYVSTACRLWSFLFWNSYNKTDNVRINVTLRRVRVTIAAVEKQ